MQSDSSTQVWACLSRLVDYRDGSELCNDAIAAQVQIIFAAGYETTANAITWALFEPAGNQQLQVTLFLSPAMPCLPCLPALPRQKKPVCACLDAH